MHQFSAFAILGIGLKISYGFDAFSMTISPIFLFSTAISGKPPNNWQSVDLPAPDAPIIRIAFCLRLSQSLLLPNFNNSLNSLSPAYSIFILN